MTTPADATTAASPDADRRGTRLFVTGDRIAGRFLVVREIAEGGMGVVYEVIDEKLNERRALKCAKPGFASHLPPEARHALRVTHPNVCRVFEIHATDTPAGPVDVLTMEYIDGGTLAHALRVHGPLKGRGAVDVATQICAGVSAAHGQGVLHRDLKSNNVLLTTSREGRVRAVVTDFGLAQEPSARDRGPLFSGVVGTRDYLAPERWRGEPATVASDVYALGVVLHEIVTAHTPKTAPDETPGAAKVLDEALPARWRRVIARCLEVDPAKRYRSVAAVAHALSLTVVRRRAIAWTAAVVVPAAVLLWPLLFPVTLAARLAVLPLETSGNDVETTTFVAGISSDVSDRLTRLRPRPPQLVVIPLETARSVAEGDVDVAQAVKDRLGATHFLRGTVTTRGDTIVVHGAIIDTATNVELRTFSSDFRRADASAIAPALAAMVASGFRLPRQRAAEEVSPAAYSAYAAGLAALQTGTSYAEATAAFERAIALDPGSVLPRAGLAKAFYNAWAATNDPAWLTRGRDALTAATALNADSVAVRIASGRLNLVPGAYDRARREYERAIQIDPDNAEGWTGLARALQEMQDHDAEAAAAFKKAIDLQPDYYAPFNDFGDFYRRRGDYEQAEVQWARVVELAPGRLSGHANLGGLYSDLGRYADAERELRRALTIDPRSRGVLNNLGALYQYMGRDADAVGQFTLARQAGPDTTTLLLNLGDSYRRLGRPGEAAAAYRLGMALAEPVLLKNPRDASNRSFVAYFALRLGERATAERELAQALSFGGESRTVVRRAAICYEALGQRDAALSVLKSAPLDVLRELGRQPDLVSLRADPRFVALLQSPKS